MAEDRAKYFTKTLKCKNRYFGFTYLGLLFRTTKPTLDFFMPMVQRVVRRPCGTTDFLNHGGKLELVKSVHSSMPIFFMCTLEVPITIKNQIIKYMSHCLWIKPNLEDKRLALVKWSTICRPQNQGGLGILNLGI